MFCILPPLLENVLHFTFSSETFLQFAKVVEFFRTVVFFFFFLVMSCILILPQKIPKKNFHDSGSKGHFCTTLVVWGSVPRE